MTSLATVARALGGDVVGRQVLCPGPGHSRKDRSLSVRLSPSAPDGFVVHSHCGDDPLEAKDHVRRLLGWEAFERRHLRLAREGVVETTPSVLRSGKRADHVDAETPATIPRRQVAEGDAETSSSDELVRIQRARRIWDEGRDPRGTVVETYLKSRGLFLPDEVAGEALRFNPRCPWRDEATGRTIFVPAMISAMRSIATEEIIGVHRTRLTADGQKVDRRMLGKASGAAIMLCPFSAIGSGLAIGEGVESCLAGWHLGWSNAWALGSVGAIARFPLLAGIEALTIFAETDDSGASAKAIESVGTRYTEAGRDAYLVTPTVPGDLNDVVRGAS